ncbi:hypothetical protein D3C73_1425500 [compost metagenome]
MPAKPIIEPMDKSNSPPIISKAAPVARMPMKAATVAQLTMPSALNIPDPPATRPNTRKTATVPDTDAASGLPSRRCGHARDCTRSSGDDGITAEPSVMSCSFA